MEPEIKWAAIVEGDSHLSDQLRELIIERTSLWPIQFSSCREALKTIVGDEEKIKPAVLLIDYNLPDGDGIACVLSARRMRWVRKDQQNKVDVFLLCDRLPPDLPEDFTVLRKPLDVQKVLKALRKYTRR